MRRHLTMDLKILHCTGVEFIAEIGAVFGEDGTMNRPGFAGGSRL